MRPSAALLASLSGALAVCVVAASQAPQSANPFAGDAAVAAAGRNLYNQICQSCHGASAQGSDRGPGLATGTFTHGNADARSLSIHSERRSGNADGRFSRLERDGCVAPGCLPAKPSALSIGGRRRLLGGVRRRDSWRRVVLRRGRVRAVSRGERARWRRRTRPVERRTTLGSGAAAEVDDPNMPMAVTTGGRGGRGASTPVTVVVKTQDGREIRGVRRNEDTFSLQMIDASGQLRLLDKLTAVIGRGRQHVAAPAGLRDPLVGSTRSRTSSRICARCRDGTEPRPPPRRRFLAA